MNKWKRMILICLWPANTMPRKGEDQSPLEWFSGVKVTPKLRYFHAFGSPTYVLDNTLQSGQGSPKWKKRSSLGVYLGPSPSHARSVALVLNPRTGHVSPQFHVKFDDFFETVQDKSTALELQNWNGSTLVVSRSRKVTPNPSAEEFRTACLPQEEGQS